MLNVAEIKQAWAQVQLMQGALAADDFGVVAYCAAGALLKHAGVSEEELLRTQHEGILEVERHVGLLASVYGSDILRVLPDMMGENDEVDTMLEDCDIETWMVCWLDAKASTLAKEEN